MIEYLHVHLYINGKSLKYSILKFPTFTIYWYIGEKNLVKAKYSQQFCDVEELLMGELSGLKVQCPFKGSNYLRDICEYYC